MNLLTFFVNRDHLPYKFNNLAQQMRDCYKIITIVV